ncbi:uncharacterized protein EV422DRAFT_396005 [Fimicolochytrium jonesii]|uniref:uncharacterized protein n=1 Tax=Fimicolochytrium jonesii TaxID=1396493 RepID=UPI0022FE1FEF|nr:uncharacterized protein EV422DRAFT_396005 [Fimicolochytrium jonesii]KAI8822366.1 hypothetical protein EV422DRAFT_396005 [Fimicolochytrium jonesii]
MALNGGEEVAEEGASQPLRATNPAQPPGLSGLTGACALSRLSPFNPASLNVTIADIIVTEFNTRHIQHLRRPQQPSQVAGLRLPTLLFAFELLWTWESARKDKNPRRWGAKGAPDSTTLHAGGTEHSTFPVALVVRDTPDFRRVSKDVYMRIMEFGYYPMMGAGAYEPYACKPCVENGGRSVG